MPTDTARTAEVAFTNVSKRYSYGASPLTVFDDLNLSFRQGHVTAILGPSGCGKSTILNLLAGLESPSSGKISSLPPDSRQTGYVFQRDRLLPWRTAMENTIFGLELQGEEHGKALHEADAILSTLDLQDFADAYPDELSEGMRQRVALCRALLIKPRLLLLDEPMSSLDIEARLRAEDLIRSFTHSTNAITVLVTHDLDEAIAVADEVILLTSRPARIKGSWRLDFRRDTDDGRTIREAVGFKEFLSDVVTRIFEAHEE